MKFSAFVKCVRFFEIAISFFRKLGKILLFFLDNLFFEFNDFLGVLKLKLFEFDALLKNTTSYDKFWGLNGLSISIIVFELYLIKKRIFKIFDQL